MVGRGFGTLPSMKQQPIGTSALRASRLSYGCMRISRAWNPADVTDEMRALGVESVLCALEAGYTLIDHADIYGQGSCESIFGEALRQKPGVREQLVIATKCGIRFPGNPNPDSPHRFDFSREYILWSCDRSRERLGIDSIDIYQLHRPDALMDPAEVADAFTELYETGKVKAFGVSNFYPSQLAALQAWLPYPLVVNQVEIHLARLACFVDGTLDQCLERKITPLSWSPIAGGMLGDGGKPRADDPRADGLTQMIDLLDQIAAKYGVSRTVMALAWLMKHPTRIVPIVGTVKPDRIQDAAKADSIELDREDWYRLYVAARMEPLP